MSDYAPYDPNDDEAADAYPGVAYPQGLIDLGLLGPLSGLGPGASGQGANPDYGLLSSPSPPNYGGLFSATPGAAASPAGGSAWPPSTSIAGGAQGLPDPLSGLRGPPAPAQPPYLPGRAPTGAPATPPGPLLGPKPPLQGTTDQRALNSASYAPGMRSPQEQALDWTVGQGAPDGGVSSPAPYLGAVSMRYEAGLTPGGEAQAAAKVSSGADDPSGGVSYGAFQLASKQRALQDFLSSEGAPWAAQFRGADPTQPNGAFAQAWRANPPSFEAQHAYIERTHYDPVVDRVRQSTGLDLDSRSPAVQEAVWSMATQHGAAAKVATDAVRSLEGQVSPTNPGYDRALVNALYDKREAYVRQIGLPDLTKRYAQERPQVLSMLPH